MRTIEAHITVERVLTGHLREWADRVCSLVLTVVHADADADGETISHTREALPERAHT